MQHQDFTTNFVVNNTREEVFRAITNPREWWSEEIEGTTDKLNGVFDYHFEDVHRCKIKVVDLVPNETVVWQVLENDFNFTNDKTEWINTKVIFDIVKDGDKTKLVFTHLGLTPEYECYEACHQGWTHYIQSSLKKYITTGKGQPNKAGAPQTDTERKLTL